MNHGRNPFATRSDRPARSGRVVLGLLLVGLICPVLHAAEAQRSIPPFYQPGGALDVQILVLPDGPTRAYSIQENLPVGWLPSQITWGGVWNPENHAVRWGPFFDNSQRTIGYRATAPAQSTLTSAFEGTVVFDNTAAGILGTSVVQPFPDTVSQTLPAEFEPGLAIPVAISITPRPDVKSFAVEEAIPPGWSVSGISAQGVYDQAQRKVKWGPFQDAVARTLAFSALPSTASPDTAEFTPVGRFDLRSVPSSGISRTSLKRRGVSRALPTSFFPGLTNTVELNVTPLFLDATWSVEETLPEGWQFISGSPAPVVDAIARKLKWGPSASVGPRTLVYLVRAPAGGTSSASFIGASSFDGLALPVTGDQSLPAATSTVSRSLPPRFQPGQPLAVALSVTPLPSVVSFSVQDTLPPGWTAAAISDDGAFDASTRTVRWGPFASHTSKILTYSAISPPASYGSFIFSGSAAFDDGRAPVSGESETAATHQVTRTMSPDFHSGLPGKIVLLRSAPLRGTQAQALQETIPDGWSVLTVSDGGSLTVGDRTIRWGPFLDDSPRTLTYTVIPSFFGADEATFSGSGAFDVRSVQTDGPSSATRTLNLPPAVLPISFEALIGKTTLLPLATILSKSVDPDGGTLTVGLLQDRSDRGAQLLIAGDSISYAAVAAQTGADRFTCLVNDSQGGVTAADIQVNLVNDVTGAVPTVKSISVLVNGSIKVSFNGTPLKLYRIESNQTLTPAGWGLFQNQTANASGLFEIVDTGTTASTTRFYRARLAP